MDKEKDAIRFTDLFEAAEDLQSSAYQLKAVSWASSCVFKAVSQGYLPSDDTIPDVFGWMLDKHLDALADKLLSLSDYLSRFDQGERRWYELMKTVNSLVDEKGESHG